MTTTELNTIAKKLNKQVYITNVYSLEDRLAIRLNETTADKCIPEKIFYSLEVKKNIFINYFNFLKQDDLYFDHFYNAANGVKQNSYKRMLTFEVKHK